MPEITKDQDQIAKDKEAVAKMIGAKDAMAAAIRRVSDLESTLGAVRSELQRIDKEVSGALYVRSFVQNEWKVIPLKEVFERVDATIRKVL